MLLDQDFTESEMIMYECTEEGQEEHRLGVLEAIPDLELVGYRILTQSIHVLNGAWIAYSDVDYSGSQYILEKGFYNSYQDWGGSDNKISSVQPIGLVGTGSSVGVMWVVCEHSNYRGRQILLETIEITNWLKFSEFNKIGSLYPVRQKRVFFCLKHRESGQYMATEAGLEDMKSGRVVVTEQLEGMSHVWFYQDGLIKNKLAPELSLQVMGKPDIAAKVVLWSETRQPRQNWRIQPDGLILSQAFEGMTLDVKGGKTYDRDHVVVWTFGKRSVSKLSHSTPRNYHRSSLNGQLNRDPCYHWLPYKNLEAANDSASRDVEEALHLFPEAHIQSLRAPVAILDWCSVEEGEGQDGRQGSQEEAEGSAHGWTGGGGGGIEEDSGIECADGRN
ncbi:CRBG2 protein, partial [Polyodon spathula]|nr:CRBG2 protein [Polyodon spathula]